MNSKGIVELNEKNFGAGVSSGLVLVDFWAPWCCPCQKLGSLLVEVAAKVAGEATVAQVNVDESPMLTAAMGVTSIPALFVIRDGQVVEQFTGTPSKSRLLKMLRNHSLAASA